MMVLELTGLLNFGNLFFRSQESITCLSLIIMSSYTSLRVIGVLCLLLLATVVCVTAENDPDRKDWIQLFNGKDMNGWIVKIAGHELYDNYLNTFRIENGVLKADYDQYTTFDNSFGLLFYNKKFSHYVLGVEYRFVGKQVPGAPAWALRNSGVMIHSQSPESMEKDQDFNISIEVQLLGGTGTGDRPTANLCTPGTNVEMNGKLITQHCINSGSKTYNGDQWVRVEVEVLGDAVIRHMVEGKTVLSYQKPQIGGGAVHGFDPKVKQDGKLLSEGYIALQGESHPIEFRKVELLNLEGCTDARALNYKSYFVKADNSQCRYEP